MSSAPDDLHIETVLLNSNSTCATSDRNDQIEKTPAKRQSSASLQEEGRVSTSNFTDIEADLDITSRLASALALSNDDTKQPAGGGEGLDPFASAICSLPSALTHRSDVCLPRCSVVVTMAFKSGKPTVGAAASPSSSNLKPVSTPIPENMGFYVVSRGITPGVYQGRAASWNAAGGAVGGKRILVKDQEQANALFVGLYMAGEIEVLSLAQIFKMPMSEISRMPYNAEKAENAVP